MEYLRLPKNQNPHTKALYEEVFPEDKGAFSDYYYQEVAPESTIYAALLTDEELVSECVAEGDSEDHASGKAALPAQDKTALCKEGCVPDGCALEERASGGIPLEKRICGMIHLNPYTLNWNGERIRIPYIVAVATKERLRHRGIMRHLLEMIFRDLDRQGVPFAFLMPVSEAIYRPFGFVRTWSWRWE